MCFTKNGSFLNPVLLRFFFFLEVSKKWLTNWLNNWPLTILCNWFLLEYSCFTIVVLISTVQQNKSAVLLFSCGVVSDSLWPHGLRPARLLCPPLSLSLLRCMCISVRVQWAWIQAICIHISPPFWWPSHWGHHSVSRVPCAILHVAVSYLSYT